MSFGHRNKFDANRSIFDLAIRVLDDPKKFVTTLDIPYLAGSSEDGHRVYRDQFTPAGYLSKVTGKWVDTDKYIRLHEVIEKILLDAGLPYLLAHQFATQMEYAAVRQDGVDINEYDEVTQSWVKVVGDRNKYMVPSDLEKRPYIDCKDQETIDKMVPVQVGV